MFDNVWIGALAIFVIRVISIALSTLRLLIMSRGKNTLVVTIAFLEALSFALTFGIVAQDLTNIVNLLSYSLGFAVGTLVGMQIEEHVAMGFATVIIISTGNSLHIIEAIRESGFGATRTPGEGNSGAVGFIWCVVRRKNVDRIVSIAQGIDKKAFVTINETRAVRQGFLGFGRS